MTTAPIGKPMRIVFVASNKRFAQRPFLLHMWVTKQHGSPSLVNIKAKLSVFEIWMEQDCTCLVVPKVLIKYLHT